MGRLPSTRDLADQLGVSRTVVLLAYDQLLAEGFAAGRSGSGTYVAEGLSSNRLVTSKKSAELRLSSFGSAAAKAAATLDFSGRRSPCTATILSLDGVRAILRPFPSRMWRRILLRRARKASVAQLDYGPAAGSLALREAICAHLRRSRAVVCDPSDVIVVNGSQQALDLIVRVLLERGDPVAIENPCYRGTREILLAAGARLLPVPVDRDGLIPAKLPAGCPNMLRHAVAPVSYWRDPSARPPSGASRMGQAKNSVIVEDDYDGEFRYEGHPLESLQGLDAEGRIIYVGTFSRTVFPALRVGYLIVPKSLAPAFTAAKWLNDQHSATLEQQTLAEFITSGAYERHLRRVRRRNTARREALLDAIHKYLGDRVEVTGDGAGAHVVLWPRQRVSEEGRHRRRRIAWGWRLRNISLLFEEDHYATGIMLGYSRMREAEIREGIRRLSEVL